MTPENEPATDGLKDCEKFWLGPSVLTGRNKDSLIDLAQSDIKMLIARIRAEQAERKRLAEIVEKLREALEWLMDFQDGPPLPGYEDGWNKVMKMGKAALAASEGKPNPSATAPPPDAGRG